MRAIYHEYDFSSPIPYFYQNKAIATLTPLHEAVILHLDTYEEFRSFLHEWVIEQKQRYGDTVESAELE